jgi:hypothetical protein
LPYIQLEIERWLKPGVERAMVASVSDREIVARCRRVVNLLASIPFGNNLEVHLKGAIPLLSPLGGTLAHEAKIIRLMREWFRNRVNYTDPSWKIPPTHRIGSVPDPFLS